MPSDAARSPSVTENDDPHMSNANIYNPNAITCCPSNNPLIDFAGQKWWTNFHWSKDSGPYVWGGDNPNEPLFGTVFDPYLATNWSENKSKVLLRIEPPNAQYPKSWRTSEICLLNNLGYGRYLVTAGTGMPRGFSGLDPNTVFGIFTYQFTAAPRSDGPNIYRELDALEVLRGSNSNAQFMLQPWDNRPPGKYFTIPAGTEKITVTLDWYLERSGQKVARFAFYTRALSFKDLPGVWPDGSYEHLDATNSNFKDLIPSHGSERFHIDLWLMHRRAPAGKQEVVMDGFEYLPPPTY